MDVAINKQMLADYSAEKLVVKILLLGTGNSGKSTILKQFKIMHTEDGLGDGADYKFLISQNIIRGITILVQGGQDLESVKTEWLSETIEYSELLRANSGIEIWGTLNVRGNEMSVSEMCKVVWQDPAVQETLKHESKLPMLEVPIGYFMEHMDRIEKVDYIPSRDDILQCRARTTGVVGFEFALDGVMCRMLDVGGQRNERKKWISHFDDVTAMLFLVSLSEFDKVCMEDNTLNRLQDALNVFKTIVDCPYFEETNIILFLNKKDLFEEKIKTVNFSKFFPEYEGPNEYTPCVDFISNQFVKLFNEAKERNSSGNDPTNGGSDIFPFQTMATNTENVRTVFNMCKHIIFKANLESTGML